MMVENEIKLALLCPPDRELDEHLKLVKAALVAQGRERIIEALNMLDGHEPTKPLTEERLRAAATVYACPEFTAYVMDEMDRIRGKALVSGDSEYLKGQLVALSDCYRFFRSAHLSTMKKDKS